MNAEFLEYARANVPNNVEFKLGDAYGSDLPAGTFDLAHMRFVASTAGSPELLLKEAARLVRPGGIVALQEPDGSTLKCYPPNPAWERLKSALLAAFKGVGADLELARKLYFLVKRAGLRDVQYHTPCLRSALLIRWSIICHRLLNRCDQQSLSSVFSVKAIWQPPWRSVASTSLNLRPPLRCTRWRKSGAG